MARNVLLWLLLLGTLGADVTILVYHRFGDDRHPSTNIPVEKLRSDFRYLRENGYQVLPLSRLTQMLEAKTPLPDKGVVLTIDDDYRSFYENGLPVFKEFGYPFTLFVYVAATERRYGDYMSWEMVREADRYGEIGLHSFDHPHLPLETAEAVTADTRKALEIFTKRMGYAPEAYAYPFGEFDQPVKEAVAAFGFKTVCNQNAGAVAAFSDPKDLDRIAVTGDTDLKRKLAIKALHVEWATPDTLYGQDTFRTISATLPGYRGKTVELYVTGYGWQRVPVTDQTVRIPFDKPMLRDRNRIILKTPDNRWGTHIALKRRNDA